MSLLFLLLIALFSFNDNNTLISEAPLVNDHVLVSYSTDTIQKPKNGRLKPSDQPFVSEISLGNNHEANYYVLRRYLDSVPAYSTVYLPSGTFGFSKVIEIKKAVRLIGSWNTKIVTGIRVMPGSTAFIKDLEVHSNGKTENGIVINGITHLENIKVYRFSGDGIHISADIHIDGANASQSTFRNVEVIECKGNGFYMRGGDANGMGFYSCSARDNGGVGFYDNSFLGNTFVTCMGHANAKGHYVAENGNNRSTFFGCYGEEDSPPSRFGGISRVTGGLLGWEVVKIGNKLIYKGTTTNYKGSGGYIITSPYAKADTQ